MKGMGRHFWSWAKRRPKWIEIGKA